jgi:hypothetical protein
MEIAGSSSFIFLYFILLKKHFYITALLYSCCQSLGLLTFQAYSGKPYTQTTSNRHFHTYPFLSIFGFIGVLINNAVNEALVEKH